MDIASTSAPYFDARELTRELEGLLEKHGSVGAARPAVVERLKELLRSARAAAARQLESDGNGRRCAEGLALLHDALIQLVFDYTIKHVYRATNPSDAERMAIVATGGFGRRLLAPSSDLDLLFVLPYKQTPWRERGRIPALPALGPGAEGRSCDPLGGAVAETVAQRHHDSYRPHRCPLHS